MPVRAASAAMGAGLAMLALSGAGNWATAEPSRDVARFAPHRAIYDLSIERTNPGTGVADVTGRIVYELTGSACEGYTQNMRFVTMTTNSEGATQTTDLRTSSWEEVPARKLRFSSSNYQNDELTEQSRGVAQRSGPVGPVTVELQRPEKKPLEISRSVYFPIQHSAALIAAARAGKTSFRADLYDGSENGAKVYVTSAVIGHQVAPGATKSLAELKNADGLARIASWPVSISYFLPEDRHKDETPVYEMSYRFHENGVTSDLRLDYGDYALKGVLKELTYLEQPKCAPGP